ncbi:hypothetical protein [Shewanella sp. 10N.286.48.A6]|uniref:hypothetical protein n=1 Tax=Shewanella sp. 10N.286.48.A6 TaxID=1880833 RepID=UPI000CC02907|nr:hypothetical protein [Shewanella sp. 10N.286.48.A6]PMH94909.1 hypothetical protein BCU55_19675 [Shewanella sp. 10N.286.48.A6]
MDRLRLISLVILLLFPLSAYAEVMDKEPSLFLVILLGVFGSVATLLTARFKPILLLIVAPLFLIYFSALLVEINDPFVGPAILKEAGSFYVNSAYFFTCFIVLSIPLGLLWLRWYKQHNKLINKD